jgi:precorrin-2 methylase
MHNRHQEHDDDDDDERRRHKFTHFEEAIIMKLNELLAINVSVKDQLNKAEQEIIAKVTTLQEKIQELIDAASNADLPQDVVDSLVEVQTAAQSLDDLNPDVVEEPPVEPLT